MTNPSTAICHDIHVNQTDEGKRLIDERACKANWKRWGPYLSERQWGTVREDYSADGNAWEYCPQNQARSRAYRWGEDGLMGMTDRECRLCFALAFWNEKDPFLKERLFGLTNPQGNHGEDVKEQYFYLDASPTYSYAKALYKYPQAAFPYEQLVAENAKRTYHDREYELIDTGVFDDGRYFDLQVEYAKAEPDDILIRMTISNRGPDEATVHVLPTLWFRNTWVWGCEHEGCWLKPLIEQTSPTQLRATHATLEPFVLDFEADPHGHVPQLLFTENETNNERLFNAANAQPYVKDAFHRYIVNGETDAVKRDGRGTKVAGHYKLTIPAGQEVVLRARLRMASHAKSKPFGSTFKNTFAKRVAETDAYYATILPSHLNTQQKQLSRQSYAGLLWSKQFYHYIVHDWLKGDPNMPPPPESRKHGRNHDWTHLFNRDVISMPDKWEYPWYAAWDLAFHMIPFADIDPDFAKRQLLLFLREWYMHPNGQLPAYEFALSDVNPPVHAWACWQVYSLGKYRGEADTAFLARAFQKLTINFTWWVNRKDLEGNHLFSGGFLGLDNIGVFDRSKPLPNGASLQQADGTAWMAFYCITMLKMAIELARHDITYEDVASKFFEHFIAIVDAMNCFGGTGLWSEQDGFYYDHMLTEHGDLPLRIRSLVGVIPLLAVGVVSDNSFDDLPGFKKRTQWFLKNRKDLAKHIAIFESRDQPNNKSRLLAIPSKERMLSVFRYLFDENEFLSPYGIRSLSRYHLDHPFTFQTNGEQYTVQYEPGESTSDMFGGNSNWRGPVWFPLNFLIIEALETYHLFYQDRLNVEYPTGSGKYLTLDKIARDLSKRLSKLFIPDKHGIRPSQVATDRTFTHDPHWRDHMLFYEYFNGDTGEGLGASHQTGWTSLVSHCLHRV